MSTNRWISGAAAVAQVDKLTLGGTWEATDILITTLTGEDGSTQSVTTVAGSTVIATARNTHLAALQASTLSLFAAITWATSSTDAITATAKVAGVPFYLTAATTETGGGAADDQTYAWTSTAANSGPYDFNTAANWSTGAIPVDGDDVYFEGPSSTANCIYGLYAAKRTDTDIQLASLNQNQNYTGWIGQATIPLQISAAEVNIGTGTGTGSGRVNLDLGSTVASAIMIFNTAPTAADAGLKPVRIKCNNASTTITVRKGNVDVAGNHAGETTVVGDISVGFGSTGDAGIAVNVNPGVTFTNYHQAAGANKVTPAATATLIESAGGTLAVLSDHTMTSVKVTGGTTEVQGTGAIGTVAIGAKGTANLLASGAITNLNNAGVADFRGSSAARTVANVKLYTGSKLYAEQSVITFTAGIDLVECALADVVLQLGSNLTLTPSAI